LLYIHDKNVLNIYKSILHKDLADLNNYFDIVIIYDY